MSVAADPAARPFHHAAFFYHDDDEYLAGTVPFVEDGLAAGEPVLVAVPGRRRELLRAALAHCATEQLRFAPMEQLGRNPAWIIPAWADFLADVGADAPAVRGIGEPIWAGRTAAELVESQRHEALLNAAFADTAGFALLCPYDTAALDERVLAEAHRSHPYVCRPDRTGVSEHYRPHLPDHVDLPLPPAPVDARRLAFDLDGLPQVRRVVTETAAAAGVPAERIADLTVAVSEAASNSIRHGGGSGELAAWRDATTFVCEVADRGLISDPLFGRVRPALDRADGRGLWLLHQLCDLVQHRRVEDGQVLRLHVDL